MARIKIGKAESLRTPESWNEQPDDRQERVEVIGGVVIQDQGVVEEGTVFSCQAIFLTADWFNIIRPYWLNRTKVTVSDESGKIYENVRVVYKGRQYLPKFPKYTTLNLEFWLV